MKLQITFFIALAHLTVSVFGNEEPAENPPYPLETVVVRAPRIPSMTTPLTQEEMLNDGRNLNAGHVVEQISGVSSARASMDTPEPVVRGLGWERVTTQVDFLPLYGSCPARMDPPAVYLSPESIENLIIVKGLPSVTYGSGGTGGRVMAQTVPHPAEAALHGATAYASSTWNGGRDGLTGLAGGKTGNGTVEAGASVNAIHLNDYESGAGKNVPAENRSYGGGATLRWTPTDDSGYWINWNMHQIDQLDYPALPMDATDVNANTLTLGSRYEGFNQSLKSIEWQAGYSAIDHVMDNANKPNRATMDAEAVTESQTLGLRLETDWTFSPDTDWSLGVDTHYLTRDALRTRTMVASGMTFQDPIWPDASQGQAGLFGERTVLLEQNSRLRLGLRLDGIFSAIEKGDELLDPPINSIAPTVREAYAYYYGAEARDTDRNELLVSGNALWEIPQGDNTQWYAGAGWVQRAASVTERFYAFAPAPGGYLVGNPALNPETKAEVDVGANYFGNRLELGAQLYCAYIWDYILETGIATDDVNGDGTDDLIRGFVNTDALLAGGELDGKIHLSQSWSIPFAVAYVRGRNVSDDRDLPLIPPLNGRLGIRWEWDKSIRPWAEIMLRAASRQDRIDPRFPETETPGYQVVDLRGGIQLPAGFSLQAGVENLFNQDYTEHLNRTAALPAGDLARGEKIPMPGRYFFVSINWAM
jgi:iron complex outermembrane receptor protein